MDSLSSSPEDEHCTEAVSMTIHKGRAGKHPSQHVICSRSDEDSSGGHSGEKLSHQEGCWMEMCHKEKCKQTATVSRT